MEKTENKNDFSKGGVTANILGMAVPMTLAQLINVLYNVVDRVYIGRIPGASTLALTGVGITFPVISIVIAFANLFGMGGAPLCSIARGQGDKERAEKVMGNSFSMLILTGICLSAAGLIFRKPILYLFGASSATFPYADAYAAIYLCGSLFVMIGLGMNSFINSQGFGKTGMTTVMLGAVVNIILDPVFIFVLHMGVKGAALATVLSQGLSAAWVLKFLLGDRAVLKLKLSCIKPDFKLILEIMGLGLSSFVMSVTNSLVQIVCNASLQFYGGDLYVGVMTVINSVREVVMMPVNGITNGAQPVTGFNYGAGQYGRVRQCIKVTTLLCVSYTFAMWLILFLIPEFFIRIFNQNAELIRAGVPSMHIYFFGFFMMALQFSGQTTFVALGKSRQAVFFSLLRKVFIVIPLTLILPGLFGLGINGVFLAEPISNFLGGSASFGTMMLTVWKRLGEPVKKSAVKADN